MLKVKKTNYKVQGEEQPCYIIYHEEHPQTYVRLAPLYFYCGPTKVIAAEYIDGVWNSESQLDIQWGGMSERKAKAIAKNLCIYLGNGNNK